jgi:uncharacterized membrane protein (DUF373 family)
LRETAVRWIERMEEGIYLVVSVLLILAAVFLVVSAVRDAIQELSQSNAPSSLVINVLDKGLVLFMVAELLHTVRITVRDRGLAAEPFLIVGLIAGIRRVLILTAQSDTNFRWNPDGIQLVILVALILVMALAILVWRRSERYALERP